MIDTHCHLYDEAFDNDLEDVLKRAETVGISKIYLPAIDSASTERIKKLLNKYPLQCFAMAGLHPCYVKENYEEELAHVKLELSRNTIFAIGEIGLDFYWDKTFISQQYDALEQQIDLAIQYNLPIVLHTRNATQQTIDVIKKFTSNNLTGIFHCFGGNLREANQIIELGFKMGIGGVLTYKNAGLGNILENVDMKHLVLETDAPYLTPVPNRGKRNEPSFLQFVVQKLAIIKNISEEEVRYITTFNAQNIFGV